MLDHSLAADRLSRGFDAGLLLELLSQPEIALRRALARAFKLTFGNFPKLFWMYLRISLVAWAGLALAAWVWFEWVRPEAGRVFFSARPSRALVMARHASVAAGQRDLLVSALPRHARPDGS